MEEIRDTNKFIKECRKTTAKTLSMPHVSYKAYTLQRGLGWCFSCPGASQAEAGNRIYEVMPFATINSKSYWLGIIVELIFINRAYRLSNTSMILFEGEGSDPIKIPILRAEWNVPNPDVISIHAQPHWHVYSSNLTQIQTDDSQLFRTTIEIKPFEDPEVKNRNLCDKFHFAMASQWHISGRGLQRIELSQDGLCKWVDGCLNYIQDQLSYFQ